MVIKDKQMKLGICKSKSQNATFLGAFLLSTGIIMFFFKSHLLDVMLPSLILKPGTLIGEFWRKPPIELNVNVYVFNWTNSEDLHNVGVKPKFEQVGPYRFVGSAEKMNITWNDNNTVTYFQKFIMNFDDKRPNGNLSDRITSINFVTASLANIFRHWSYFTKTLLSSMLFSTVSPSIQVHRSVKEILYNGYDDFYGDLAQYVGYVLPQVPPLDNFGMVSIWNNSYSFDKFYNTEIGVGGSYQVRNWDYNNTNPNYEGACSRIRGNTGELIPQKEGHFSKHIDLFFGLFCRHFPLEYEEDVMVEGTLGHKYTTGDRILDNGTLFPENRCFCPGDCMPSGLLNLSSCFFGIPLFAALPHFYNADPFYANSVEGMSPEKAKHETYVVIEPKTGIPLKSVLRVQGVTLLQPAEGLGMFESVPKIYFPLFWLDLETTIPDQLWTQIKLYLIFPTIYSIISYVLITAGLCLSTFGIILRRSKANRLRITAKPEDVPLRCEEKTDCDTIVRN